MYDHLASIWHTHTVSLVLPWVILEKYIVGASYKGNLLAILLKFPQTALWQKGRPLCPRIFLDLKAKLALDKAKRARKTFSTLLQQERETRLQSELSIAETRGWRDFKS